MNTGAFTYGLPVAGIDRVRYVRRFEMDFLDATSLPAADKELSSNELHYNHVNPTPTTLTTWSADARMNVQPEGAVFVGPTPPWSG